MNFMETIERPWKHPVEYIELVFWTVIFIIAAFAMADTLRVLGQWIKETGKG